ncbi:hypothetical protein [Cryobacterium sp. SO1]|uniref:hypothetical protein n=1 Tax=Cryobacterium sp. SO1 TaxID=1897061 RepID=UPI001022E1AE|nr:hypothetical protein [Cryobacterium sp. SO1]RZI36381.1 hypothetical protein BJQ95_01172 [Cryobacterium sp. SO1]
MTKRVTFLRTGVEDDPIETIIGDILTVHSINGHIASLQEVEEELRAHGRLGSIGSDVEQIRSRVAARIHASRRASALRRPSVDDDPGNVHRFPSCQDLDKASPYDLCLMYSTGDLLEKDIVRVLTGFDYGTPLAPEFGRSEPASQNTWQEVEDALSDKLIERSVYAILRESRSANLGPDRPAQ